MKDFTGKNPHCYARLSNWSTVLQRLQEMNVWLWKGHWCACTRDGSEALCRRERLPLDMLGTVPVSSYLSFNSTLL